MNTDQIMEQLLPFRFKIYGMTEPAESGPGLPDLAFDKCGFFFCRKGYFDVVLNGRNYRIEPGKMFVYMPTCMIRFVGHGEGAEGVVVDYDLDDMIPMVNKVIETQQLFFLRENPYVMMSEPEYWSISRLVDSLEEKVRGISGKTGERRDRKLLLELLRSLGQTLCLEVLNVYFANQPMAELVQSKKDLVFQNFMLNLFRSYRRQREVVFYARQQHLSPRYFSTVIKERSGYSASQWIVRLVLAESKYLLSTTNLSIKEIADRLNFPSQSFFGRYFKQYAGISPKDFRQEISEGRQMQDRRADGIC